MVRFIRSTWPFVHGCRGLVSRCSTSRSAQAASKEWQRKGTFAARMALMSSGPAVAGWIGEVSAVVGEHRVDPVGHGRDEVTKEVARNAPRRLLVQLDKGELARAV